MIHILAKPQAKVILYVSALRFRELIRIVAGITRRIREHYKFGIYACFDVQF
jgi:hypothetical protein